MNTKSGNDRHEGGEERDVHERLCAHVLGELDAADGARLERELAASPELRAERERIAATIDCVRGALGGSEALSPQLLDGIERASKPPRPWHAAGWVRAAAGFALFAIGLAGVRVWTDFDEPTPERELAARVDFAPPKSSPELEERAKNANEAPHDAADRAFGTAAAVEPPSGQPAPSRAEVRRGGKECRARWAPYP